MQTSLDGVPKIIVPVKLFCPHCGARHVDETRKGERWDRRAHTTHRCQNCNRDFDVYVSGAPDEIPPGPADPPPGGPMQRVA